MSLASCLALALPVPVHARTAPPDLAALIECRGDMAGFMALAPALQDPLEAVALGWQPLPQANMFMTEYRLASPIRVFGHESGHIAFSGGSVMAILDLPDPRPLASELGLETAIDTPAKAMFGKELRSEESRDAESGQVLIESVILNVSNVSSHPGKTLVGCSYSLDLPEDAPDADADAPVPDGAPPPASGGQPR
ncbi:MAG: hypothetical protein A2213_01005 [Lysobacterales bacterium RIFOXYA1_FULL_68_6]|nr:MAG: hypothetical protein A2213_01005 [Xanthomonadales bacterium RIFOXYA1_FULL_68_6]